MKVHQRQGCEGLIEIDSTAVDCKPTVVDRNLDFHAEIDENQINNDKFNDHVEQPLEKQSNRCDQSVVVQQPEGSADGIKTYSYVSIYIDNQSKQSNNNSKRIVCENCSRSFVNKSSVRLHNVHCIRMHFNSGVML